MVRLGATCAPIALFRLSRRIGGCGIASTFDEGCLTLLASIPTYSPAARCLLRSNASHSRCPRCVRFPPDRDQIADVAILLFRATRRHHICVSIRGKRQPTEAPKRKSPSPGFGGFGAGASIIGRERNNTITQHPIPTSTYFNYEPSRTGKRMTGTGIINSGLRFVLRRSFRTKRPSSVLCPFGGQRLS